MLSRRDLLKHSMLIPAIAVGGGTALLYPAPARAWVTAALAVAQAGFQLYQMSRSGGGGIGSLLAAHTEMLRAINEQLKVIGGTVAKIYDDMQNLKGMVGELPRETTKELYRTEVEVMIGYSSQVLEAGRQNAITYGIAEAIRLDNGASQKVLDRIGPATIKVDSDPSTANVPLMCLAWYTEFQVMTHYTEFNGAKIATRAKFFADYFTSRIGQIEADLAQVDRDAAALKAAVALSPGFAAADCFDNVSMDLSERSCGHDGNLSCYLGFVHANHVVYTPFPEAQDVDRLAFLQGAADLDALGVKVSQALQETAVPRWTFSSGDYSQNFRGASSSIPYSYKKRSAEVNARRCIAGRADKVAGYFAQQDELKRRADKLRLRSVVNHHLLLAARDALASATAIQLRVTTV